MGRFERLYKKHVKDSEYKINHEQSFAWNNAHLKRMAYFEDSCRILWEKLEATFGEEYANFILERIFKDDFTVTRFNIFPNKEFPFCTERVYLAQSLTYNPLQTTPAHTLLTFQTAVTRILLSEAKQHGAVELYDFFICLGMLIEKWKVTEYPKYIVHRETSDYLLKQFIKSFVHSLYTTQEELQNITLAILDKKLFEDCLLNAPYPYEVLIDMRKGKDTIKPTYDMYLKGIRIFLDIIKGSPINRELQPAIRTYASATNKVLPEVLEYIETEAGIDIGVLYDIFKNVNFDAHPQWIESPEYQEAFEKIENIQGTKKKVNYGAMWHKIKDIFATDYINYLNPVDRKLAYLFNEYNIEKLIHSYETVYYKKKYDFFSNKMKQSISEVTINAEYITKDCHSQEEFRERLYKAVIDAQAINQMRVTLLDIKPKSRYLTRGLLNVKLDNVDEDLKSFAYSVMYDATEYLKSTYSLPFSFEMTQRMFFRDKTRVCYLKL